MHVTYGEGAEHARRLKRGLDALGPDFVASICWWCDGTTMRKCENCHVCGKDRIYGSALGLLINNQPAPESVVNQVLVAAERKTDVLSPSTEGACQGYEAVTNLGP